MTRIPVSQPDRSSTPVASRTQSAAVFDPALPGRSTIDSGSRALGLVVDERAERVKTEAPLEVRCRQFLAK
jgi:hypothetical protein